MEHTISDVMTTAPTCLDLYASIEHAAQVMATDGIGDVIVCDGDTMVGILTDRDIVVRGLARGMGPSTPVAEICTPRPVAVSPDETVGDASLLMRARAVRRVPVIEDGRPVGIVSLGDVAIDHDPGSPLSQISAAPART
jgi:CBS domain-containing protein